MVTDKIDKESLEKILETMEAVKAQRISRGNWSDDEWGEEGILSMCEGLECFLSPYCEKKAFENVGLENKLERALLPIDILKGDIKKLVGNVNSSGFIPAPYFAARHTTMGVVPAFTDTVSYIVTTLLDYSEFMKIKKQKVSKSTDIGDIIRKGIDWLLNNIQDDGGYSWGEKQFKPSHVYCTYTACVALVEYKKNMIFKADEKTNERIENNLKKIRIWFENGQRNGKWTEFGAQGEEGGKEPLYSVYALYTLNLLGFENEILDLGIKKLLEDLKRNVTDFRDPIYHTIKGEPWKVALQYEDHTTPGITLQLLLNQFVKTTDEELKRELIIGIRTLYDILMELRDSKKKYWRSWGYRTYFNQAAIEALLAYALSPPITAETFSITTEQLYSSIKSMLSSEAFVSDFANRLTENLRIKLGIPATEKIKKILKDIEKEK